jgi:tRNA (adenine37-N6)-methyltransferase
MDILLSPIGQVISSIPEGRDDHWSEMAAEIRLDESQFGPASLEGLRDFSHVEVVFYFDQIREEQVEKSMRHPRENPRWPKIGIFAQRGRKRPNRLGATICEIVSVAGLSLHVRGLDAFNGSPVLDIKPVMVEFIPDRKSIRQPQWSRELMSTYF